MIIRAAITPGIHPKRVRIKTIKIEPQPLSITARGGNKIESRTRQILIVEKLVVVYFIISRFLFLLLQLLVYIFLVAIFAKSFFRPYVCNFLNWNRYEEKNLPNYEI